MAFPGRIEREHWIAQAKLLAAGLDTAHSSAVKSGAITIDDTADAPLSGDEADALLAQLPDLAPAVENEDAHAGRRPLGLAAPRGGQADDLKLIKGIGFDATCSLVVLDRQGAPVTVSSSGDPTRNVIVWMDHRALSEARDINATKDEVLRYVGGSISPEMEMPKLLWLKRHLRTSFDGAGHFFDLADFLTWRATGAVARSMCTVTCKWNYLAHEARWSADYFHRIGLDEFVKEDYARIGTEIVAPGTALGHGLSRDAAAELGLVAGTPVGAALI
ncbi:MAG: FGGY family carbohydrate kinase, partial [Bradyrhizobium sp.]|nr:FGGY family carbohydrate kinase [Bradyrhizobium sp.]